MRHSIWLLALLLLPLGWSACEDEAANIDDTYVVDIDILSPAPNSSFSAGGTMSIEVRFTRANAQIVHNVRLYLLDANEQVLDIIHDGHEDAVGTFFYQNPAYALPGTPGSYSLRAVSDDHGEQVNELRRAFTLN